MKADVEREKLQFVPTRLFDEKTHKHENPYQ